MRTLLTTIGVPVLFLALVMALWLGIHLLANRLLGERKQGCKGPVPDEQGDLLCCKGDGSPCEELNQNGSQSQRRRDS